MRGKWVVAAVSVILAAIAAGALSVLWKKAEAPAAPVKQAPPSIPSGTEVSLPGKVEAQHIVLVPAPVEGVIEESNVEVGDEVFEGQILARIRNEGLNSVRDLASMEHERAQNRLNALESSVISGRLEASRARAEAARSKGEYDRLQRNYDRQSLLVREGATPRLVFEKAEKDYTAAQLEYEALEARAKSAEERVSQLLKDVEIMRKNLEDKKQELEEATSALEAAVVHSPVDGLVVARSGAEGDEVARNVEDLFQIAVDLSLLQAVLEPEPPMLARLRPELVASVFLTEAGNEPIPGSILEIDGNRVVVEFTSPDPAIKPGLTAHVRIKLP